MWCFYVEMSLQGLVKGFVICVLPRSQGLAGNDGFGPVARHDKGRAMMRYFTKFQDSFAGERLFMIGEFITVVFENL